MFERIDIKRDPRKISNDEKLNISDDENLSSYSDKEIIDKLSQHLQILKDYEDRLESIQWLLNNASNLSNSLKFETNDDSVKSAIISFGRQGNVVDFELFKEAIEIYIQGIKESTLMSLTGVKNGI